MQRHTGPKPETTIQTADDNLSTISKKRKKQTGDQRYTTPLPLLQEINSVYPPFTNDWTHQELLEYFINGWQLNDLLFSSITDEAAFYENPDPLRNPLIFYLGHTAAFCINKLKQVGLMDKGINEPFEKLFEIGVDPADEAELAPDLAQTQWPSVQAVWEYRQKAFEKMVQLIKNTTISMPITWESPLWAVLMGFEHDRIHFETSSMLFRQLDAEKLERPAGWTYAPMNQTEPALEMLKISGGKVTLGKHRDHPTFGWDNEYGSLSIEVSPFTASKHMITNRQFAEFVQDGGYQNQAVWGEHAWQWNQDHHIQHPKFWVPHKDSYRYRALFDVLDMPWDWPAEVSHYEAMAYCRWKGNGTRLLTEAEWNLISGDHQDQNQRHQPSSDPMYSSDWNLNIRYGSPCAVGSLPGSVSPSGCTDVFGNTWEWLHDDFRPLPGFETHVLYKNFSIPFFDTFHATILGGSWATTGTGASKFYRLWFRRYFYQHAGFRIAQDIT